MVDQLRSMQVFVKVAEAGSFSAAATRLGMSAQMVGRYVTRLEERLGARLLNRTNHSQSLTDAGRTYLAGCRDAISKIAEVDLSVSVETGAVRGLLKITAPLGMGAVLSRNLPFLLEKHAALRIELDLSDRHVDLVAGGFDAGIRIGDLPDSELVARNLGIYRCVTCASPEYLRRRAHPETPHDLYDHHCLDFVFPTHPSPHLWTFRRGEEVVRIEPEARFAVNDCRALVEAAVHGFGVIQVGEVKVREELASGRLMALLPEWEAPQRPLQLVMAASRLRSPALRAFADWLAGVGILSNIPQPFGSIVETTCDGTVERQSAMTDA